jgi:hypothetical protein
MFDRSRANRKLPSLLFLAVTHQRHLRNWTQQSRLVRVELPHYSYSKLHVKYHDLSTAERASPARCWQKSRQIGYSLLAVKLLREKTTARTVGRNHDASALGARLPSGCQSPNRINQAGETEQAPEHKFNPYASGRDCSRPAIVSASFADVTGQRLSNGLRYRRRYSWRLWLIHKIESTLSRSVLVVVNPTITGRHDNNDANEHEPTCSASDNVGKVFYHNSTGTP